MDEYDLQELRVLAARLAQVRQADILLYSGPLSRPRDGQLMPGRQDRPARSACLLLLSTLGGSSDAAYRLVRTLRRRYARLTVYVDDYCKGGGMLLALAAHELVLSDFGELGPLDLYQQHPITPGHGESGLSLTQGLQALRLEAETSFEQHLARLRSRRMLPMTSRAAIEQASAMTVGLLGPVFSQIDPVHIAEADRAQRTGRLYAERLALANLKEGALDRLLTGYPSHDFVIDREEATDLLRTVRAPTSDEAEFLTYVEPVMHDRRTQSRLLFLDDALGVVEGRSWTPETTSDNGGQAAEHLDGPVEAPTTGARGDGSSG
jgi:hypothetical protein